ncbi:S-formylglutathione hydrolase [Calothrix sp. PCC 6303]|uniref:S-formylglutathione hydrolase n=1 Tax=Calothrix sp. PCC 6303 TaxID=1170562 RepID=UPI0002A05672|nr:S-formylglutathione hydrolase [Calothrix sp. PCC 6303]AFZ00218.1 S-formylglutathione hydrolase [Calothrix sp. PCC 6303]
MMPIYLKSEYKNFGGKLGFYKHHSTSCNCEMRFAIYQPPQAKTQAVPVLYFLSGLSSTEENFMIKAGAQRYAAEYGITLVVPDTSPRNTGIEGEDDTWDFGSGAGFYVDAKQNPWSSHYKMYSYVVEELPQIIASNFPVKVDKQGIFGHSMGGHGALICALRNPEKFKSVSAFAPIVAPIQSPWGQKILSAYIGDNKADWYDYDASELIKKHQFPGKILIDQGTSDEFILEQLKPELFIAACHQVNQPLELRFQDGYDHNYYFISSFVREHIQHHLRELGIQN